MGLTCPALPLDLNMKYRYTTLLKPGHKEIGPIKGRHDRIADSVPSDSVTSVSLVSSSTIHSTITPVIVNLHHAIIEESRVTSRSEKIRIGISYFPTPVGGPSVLNRKGSGSAAAELPLTFGPSSRISEPDNEAARADTSHRCFHRWNQQ